MEGSAQANMEHTVTQFVIRVAVVLCIDRTRRGHVQNQSRRSQLGVFAWCLPACGAVDVCAQTSTVPSRALDAPQPLHSFTAPAHRICPTRKPSKSLSGRAWCLVRHRCVVPRLDCTLTWHGQASGYYPVAILRASRSPSISCETRSLLQI